MPAPSSISPKTGSTLFLKDVEELWGLGMGTSQSISLLLPCALLHFSSLCYFTFQQKSLKIGLCDKFFISPVLQQNQERVLWTWACPDTALEGQGSSLGPGHLGQEGSGAGSPGLCLLFLLCGGGNFNTSVPTKDSKLFLHSDRDLWTAGLSSALPSTGLCLHVISTEQHTRLYENPSPLKKQPEVVFDVECSYPALHVPSQDPCAGIFVTPGSL